VPVAIFLTAAAAFFWIGFAYGANQRYRQTLGALTAGVVVVCGVALHQHFIGFPQTLRDAADAAGTLSPELRERLSDLMAKLRQGRVFGTLFYPNALAGFLILIGPPACCWLWLCLHQRLEGNERLVRSVSIVAAAALAGMVLWCLLLTKSKGGFLMLALALAAGLMFCRPVSVRWRVGALASLVVLGVICFGTAGLRRGIETIEARGDYWRGGLAMVAEQPWLGSGPGTFGLRYVTHRPADAEWTRLAHNNYLQQWTDSGIIGFASYAALWIATLWLGAPRSRRREEAERSSDDTTLSAFSRRRLPLERGFEPLAWATWIGLAAWALHNLVDFDLYIAAIAWPAFLMAGWLIRLDAAVGRSSGKAD
jgi:O-antigen ligase